ncbi:FKBP-type peptidyl-prolyl cis-trans isomerase SlyD [Brevinematales bacterium NS]|nr:peptidylprolyl isomerase [Brevinematales bacterium]QJR21708.1 FKBP-type peptidyl-prolyl cis-trans isomerase SlyD [Brevinematales bacterium NS]
MIQENKYVEMAYTLKDTKGVVIDSSPNYAYIHGQGLIIPGLEKYLDGKNEGDELTVTIPAAEAYGDYNPEFRFEVEKSQIEGADRFEEGMFVYGQDGEHYHIFRVVAIGPSTITLDGNHPLAGMDLVYEIKILKVRDATKEDFDELMGHDSCEGCNCDDDSCDCH